MSYSLSFTKAILVVIFIADKMRQGQYDYLSTRYISQVLNIPRPTLVQILKRLTAAGIIQTKEGKHGGVLLTTKPADLSVLDIFEAIEQGKHLFNTDFDIIAQGQRPDKAQAILLQLFTNTEAEMKRRLAQKTIAEILNEMSN